MPDRLPCNPQLAAVIHDAATRPTFTSAAERLTHAAVRGWREGHIDAHRTRNVEPTTASESGRGPGPAADELNIDELLALVSLIAAPDDIIGAVALAAGAGWAGGVRAGRACPGCAWTSTSEEDALRDGLADLTLFGSVSHPEHYGRIELPVLFDVDDAPRERRTQSLAGA